MASGQRVKLSKAVSETVLCQKWVNNDDVHVLEPVGRQSGISQWRVVRGSLSSLSSLPRSCPGAAALLHTRPHESLGNVFCCHSRYKVAKTLEKINPCLHSRQSVGDHVVLSEDVGDVCRDMNSRW